MVIFMPAISLRSAIQNSVSISNFNKGMAGKIFSEVRSSGPKVVIKNNNPECVIMSPEEYIAMLDEIEEMRLMLLAGNRLNNSTGQLISHAEVLETLDISQAELDEMEDVEIE